LEKAAIRSLKKENTEKEQDRLTKMRGLFWGWYDLGGLFGKG